MKDKSDKKVPSPEKLINEGFGNQQKFQSKTYRKIKGKIDEDKIESIDKAEREDIKKKDA